MNNTKPDPSATLAFLERINRRPEAITWQTWPDRSNDQRNGLARCMHGRGHALRLTDLNRRRAAIGFASQRTDLKGRQLRNIVEAVGLLLDFDHGIPSDFTLEPTARVITSINPETGECREQWHVRLAPGSKIDPETWRGVMGRCVLPVSQGGFGADPNAADMARCGRLPGFYHWKAEPRMVKMMPATGTAPFYTPDQFLSAIPPYHPPPRPMAFPSEPVAHPDCYIAGAVRGVVADLATAPRGTRNPTLNRAAFRLGQLGLDIDDVTGALLPTALEIGLHANEIIGTIRSGATAGVRNIRGGA
jgi:hypothetical protein